MEMEGKIERETKIAKGWRYKDKEMYRRMNSAPTCTMRQKAMHD